MLVVPGSCRASVPGEATAPPLQAANKLASATARARVSDRARGARSLKTELGRRCIKAGTATRAREKPSTATNILVVTFSPEIVGVSIDRHPIPNAIHQTQQGPEWFTEVPMSICRTWLGRSRQVGTHGVGTCRHQPGRQGVPNGDVLQPRDLWLLHRREPVTVPKSSGHRYPEFDTRVVNRGESLFYFDQDWFIGRPLSR